MSLIHQAFHQVTKLFGVNYDTPTSSEPIHASMSQLSQPGSYMLAPSYSEALLMDPATPRNDGSAAVDQQNWTTQQPTEVNVATDIVPSYSEALLYERAEQFDQQNATANVAESGNVAAADATKTTTTTTTCHNVGDASAQTTLPCECHCPCPCHETSMDAEPRAAGYEARPDERSYVEINPSSEDPQLGNPPASVAANDAFESEIATLRTTADGRLHPPATTVPARSQRDDHQVEASPSKCGSCGRMSASTQTINSDQLPPERTVTNKSSGSSQTDFPSVAFEREHRSISRDISEPNLRSRSEQTNAIPKNNIRSLENILEEELAASRAISVNAALQRAYALESRQRRPVSRRSLSLDEDVSPTRYAEGESAAIPRERDYEPRSRITVNPMSNEACWKLPNSKTYFCLKSILKQNRRRYTLVTADEFQNLADANRERECIDSFARGEKIEHDVQPGKPIDRPRSRERLNPRRRMPSFEEFMSERNRSYVGDQKREGFR